MMRIIQSGEALIVLSVVLVENIKFYEWKDLKRGGVRAPVNNAYPTPLSICVTPPLLSITWLYLRTDRRVYQQKEADQRPLDRTLVKKISVF